MNVMEEIFEIRSCIEILANDIKVNTADENQMVTWPMTSRDPENNILAVRQIPSEIQTMHAGYQIATKSSWIHEYPSPTD